MHDRGEKSTSARRQLWDLIEEFKAAGRTIVLTTHYMEEAERLCGRVTIMDHGKVIAQGTPRELIASIGVEHVVEFSAGDTALDLAGINQACFDKGVVLTHLQLRKKSLETKFMELTHK